MQIVGRTSGAPASTGSFAATYPTHQAGDRTIIYVGGKYNGTTIPASPSGMVRVTSVGGGTGSAAADTGTTFGAIYVREHTASGESNPTFTAGGTAPNTWAWVAITVRLDSGETWEDGTGDYTNAEQWFQDANTASPFGVAANSALSRQPSAGDWVFAFGTVPSDSASAIGSATMSGAGLSGGTVDTTGGYQSNSLGDDCAVVMARWYDFTGTATGTITPNFTLTGGTNHSGIGFVLAVRAVQPPDTADAGDDQTAEANELVTLDGSGSSSTGTWSQLSGASVTLSNTGVHQPTFTAPILLADEALTFRYTVGADTDDVTVTVRAAQRRLLAADGTTWVPYARSLM